MAANGPADLAVWQLVSAGAGWKAVTMCAPPRTEKASDNLAQRHIRVCDLVSILWLLAMCCSLVECHAPCQLSINQAGFGI